ncbi:BirA family biotin operon repressor/biotin-[acetyl-CoA-carboxylase] ligase [Albidovulum inexpectatum]|uniref:biotin--[biotin carboxyl-carrier protein] ligase n=1 Tax=Albidovulum inexpectatum TaxID=196587 RepID=A0A2S5JKM6_9RHOB|nr:BirA family biotin operon repressor/biotin-[acetyl-CoA-carboxylase] ligase [Albidovulum inexpectatum]
MDRVVLEEVDSTNAEAARRAASVLQPTWIMARRQTAGRGRRGRAWISPAGNFAATLIMRPECGPDEAALRSFVAALSVADALEQLTEAGSAISLKWPNDVLLNGGKVAGILLESAGQGGTVGHLMIGIGVNLIAAPPPEAVEPGAMAPVSVLKETGIRITPESFLAALARSFDRHDRQLREYGFGPIRTAWLARAARLGQPVTARLPNETVSGTFETISDSGALVLATAQGRRHIPAADIYF